MDIYVGSSCESQYGVGALMKWNVEDVSIEYDSDREEGAWKVTEFKSGIAYYCYDLMQLHPSFDSIEEDATPAEIVENWRKHE